MTPQQQAVIDSVADGVSLAVRAVAGSGKTTTLIAALAKVTTPTLALAFNKSNAVDLQARLPAGSPVEARTLNSLGHRIWGDHLRKRLSVESDKLGKLVKAHNIAGDLSTEEYSALMRLTRVAKSAGISPGMLNKPDPDYKQWFHAADSIDIPEETFLQLAPLSLRLLRHSVKAAWEGQIDYDDQLYMPVIFNSPFPTVPRVAVDEAQDLSPLQHEMVARLRAKQHLIVGDPNQAIYGFRGASTSSFTELTTRFSLQLLPLTTSFRCPHSVGSVARQFVPDFECADANPAGSVREAQSASLAPGAILCRFNAPLVRLAFRALRERVPFNFLGRDFLAGLKAIHKINGTRAKLDAWRAAKLAATERAGQRRRIQDQFDTLAVLHEETKSPGGVLAALNDLGSPKNAALTLSTVHKAKGMEWPAVQALEYQSSHEGQEGNICYVQVTRAQESLTIIERLF